MDGSSRSEPEVDGMAVVEPFMGAISHSINNLMGSIRLNIGWLESLHPDFAEVAREMDRGAKRLQGLGQGWGFLLREGRQRAATWSHLADCAAELLRAILGSTGVSLRFRRLGGTGFQIGASRLAMLALLVAGITTGRGLARGERVWFSASVSTGCARFRFRSSGSGREPARSSPVLENLVAHLGGYSKESDRGLELHFPGEAG